MDVTRLSLHLLVILSLCTAPAWSWNTTFICTYVESFFYVMGIQEIVWFMSQRLDVQQSEYAEAILLEFAKRTNASQFVWTNRSDVRMKKIESKRVALAIAISTSAKDPVMQMHDSILTGRHFGMSLILYAPKVSDLSDIEQILLLLAHENFVNCVVYFQTAGDHKDNLFSFRKYPKFEMINKTDYMKTFKEELRRLAHASVDVEGYAFQTPLRLDVPNVFPHNNRKDMRKIQGSAYRMLESFIESINGRLEEYDATQAGKVVNMVDVFELVRSKEIHLSAHAYALFKTDEVLDKSYPLLVVKWCLMIPLRNSISTQLYTLQPFEGKVWLLFGVVFIIMCVLDLIRWYMGLRRQQLSVTWLNNFCHLINISPARAVRRRHGFLYYTLIFWFGFFLSANYTSFLGSSLTVTIFREQINTMQDVVRAQLPVMIIDYELKFLLSEDYALPVEFEKLLVPVDPATFYDHQMSMNTSFGYFVTDDRWRFLNSVQRHLKQKLFKFSNICFGSYVLAYPMEMDSPIWRNLEYFLFRIHSSGLFQMYESKALKYALSAGFIPKLVEMHEYASAGLEHLAVTFMLLAAMHAVGVVCFLLENILHRYIVG